MTKEMKSKSEMRRLAHQNPSAIINENLKLRDKINRMKEIVEEEDITCGECLEGKADGYTICGDCAAI